MKVLMIASATALALLVSGCGSAGEVSPNGEVGPTEDYRSTDTALNAALGCAPDTRVPAMALGGGTTEAEALDRVVGWLSEGSGVPATSFALAQYSRSSSTAIFLLFRNGHGYGSVDVGGGNGEFGVSPRGFCEGVAAIDSRDPVALALGCERTVFASGPGYAGATRREAIAALLAGGGANGFAAKSPVKDPSAPYLLFRNGTGRGTFTVTKTIVPGTTGYNAFADRLCP